MIIGQQASKRGSSCSAAGGKGAQMNGCCHWKGQSIPRSSNATTQARGASPRSNTCCSSTTQGSSLITTSRSLSPHRMSKVMRPHQTCHLARVRAKGLEDSGWLRLAKCDHSQPGDSSGSGILCDMVVSPSTLGLSIRSPTSRPRASCAMPFSLMRSRRAGACSRFWRRMSSNAKLKSKKGNLETKHRTPPSGICCSMSSESSLCALQWFTSGSSSRSSR
mmetsp:Transcript_113068/g.269566  ORF Transcript_113068/g.269566 Transcript_113068/m.269566 type:complete len:220 (-) Transcript_113068:835-1494(-)